MDCMCEKAHIKYKLRIKSHQRSSKNDNNNSKPFEAKTYRKPHPLTYNEETGEETTSNVPADYLDEVGNFITSKLVKISNSISSRKSNLAISRHYLVRHSLSFYAASSVILALCYLTTTTSAATSSESHSIFAEGKSDKEILDHLLKDSRYDKRLLPPVDDADFCCGLESPEMAKNMTWGSLPGQPQNRGTLTVNVNVLLLSLASPDESSLKYEVEFLLNQQWHDPRLRYANQSKYEFLNAIHHHNDIWLPDTYFIMHGDFKEPLIPMHFALRIFRNGTITYSMRRHLILSCQGSLNIFPFDDPLCTFSLESISYELLAIKYVWKNDEATLRNSPSLTTLNAYLIKNATKLCPVKGSWRADGLTNDNEDVISSLYHRRLEHPGNYSCLRVDLIFTRDRAFYFTTVFIPGIILVTSSFITFWLEWNAVPARSMIGNYSCLSVNLTFTRDRAFYFTTVFIPGIILVTSSFITFWLEWNAVPARVMIGVTTMLNFFTTSNGFRSTLPVVSNLTAMNVWDGVCMCFIYASLLEFVCVNYVGRKRPLHNVVYRPGENPVTQRLPAVLSRIGVILASPLETIEEEFRVALTSEKRRDAIIPTLEQVQLAEGMVHPASQFDNSTQVMLTSPDRRLSTVSLTRRGSNVSLPSSHTAMLTPEEAYMRGVGPAYVTTNLQGLSHLIETTSGGSESGTSRPSTPTMTPAPRIVLTSTSGGGGSTAPYDDVERGEGQCPVRPPRRKICRSTRSEGGDSTSGGGGRSTVSPSRRALDDFPQYEGVEMKTLNKDDDDFGEKKRDTSGPNEIVACTNCGGGTSPCTHTANNGCATETCFVQVRKKEPPHPIRVAKTIDVIARITFPTAYAIFLIFFFIHYKGFS